MRLIIFSIVCLLTATATTFFKEEFLTEDWESRWVISDWKKSDGTQGKWKWTAGDWYADESKSKGIMTSEDARFYAISAKAPAPFNNRDKDLIIQFSIRHTQQLDCGGGYIKVLPPGLDQSNFNGESEYSIMFGPDVCGTSTKKVHAIFSYQGKNYLIKKDVRCETDQRTHYYTFVIKPDNTYQILIDHKEKAAGSLEDDWEMLLPKKIKDPKAVKPSDWEDNAEIDDPDDVKPEGWDDIPAKLPDPQAVKPEEWTDDDGIWEPPLIDNPEYKGEWKPKKLPNPNYKGVWVAPEIDNPDFKEDKDLYIRDYEYVGMELWQVKSGSIFDNILITDDLQEAKDAFAEYDNEAEKVMFDKVEAEKKKHQEEERKKLEEERKKQEAAKEEEEDDDDDEKEEL